MERMREEKLTTIQNSKFENRGCEETICLPSHCRQSHSTAWGPGGGAGAPEAPAAGGADAPPVARAGRVSHEQQWRGRGSGACTAEGQDCLRKPRAAWCSGGIEAAATAQEVGSGPASNRS